MASTSHTTARRESGHVLVVGAGPAGLATAITLGRQGISVTLFDMRTGDGDAPKAIGISLRTMEHLRGWGLEDAVRAASVDVDLAILQVERLVDVEKGRRHEMNVPTPIQSAVTSPTSAVRIAQDELERILLRTAKSLPTVDVQRGIEVLDVAVSTDGVAISVARTGSGGGPTVLRGDYLVGADGARSAIRESLGIGFSGDQDAMIGVSCVFTAPLWEIVGERRYAVYSIPGGVLIPAGGDRWQFGQVLDSRSELRRAVDPESVIERLRAAVGVDGLVVDVHRIDGFAAGAQVANQMRVGRVLLAGDAAHRVTPRGGIGQSMAIRDGVALGWRLAWVLHGWADEEFLDGYEHEMRPVVEHDVARAASPEWQCDAGTEMLHDLGGRITHAWVDAGENDPVSVLDFLGDGLTLFTGDADDRWESVVAGMPRTAVPPVALVRLSAMVARAVGINPGGGAQLVRPDGVPIAAWWSADGAAGNLLGAVESFLREAVVDRGLLHHLSKGNR